MSALKSRLDELYDAFNVADAAEDPVQFLAGYDDPADREVVAFCAGALAFGRVASVKASIARVLQVLGPHPAAYIRDFSPRHHAAAFDGFVHRWTRGNDIVALFLILQHMLRQPGTGARGNGHGGGSIEDFFLVGLDPAAADIGPALDSFCTRACEVDVRVAYGGKKPPVRAGVRYFFPRPSGGSGCKRLNLFLRWMVRRDEVDPGGWTRVKPSQLVIPLDTHVIRVGRCLRLTKYTSPGWKMAADITRALRQLDPIDPVRYDFSLCHLGMMNACGFTRAQGDHACPLRGHCRPTVRKPRASPRPSAPR
jgi:uncharacterized protein (TIGR02757 family)